ncbi:hypothetical protein [Thermoactinospora rubra]|uniref:rhamnogalacturonan lyase family protein n=1 Tax=Thermoactinospora rubra TaxID=1088767 RepID=UPI003B84535E
MELRPGRAALGVRFAYRHRDPARELPRLVGRRPAAGDRRPRLRRGARLRTLMHDPVYRLGVAWQNVGYNQLPHPGFYLGTGMTAPEKPRIRYARGHDVR